jgi:hypothetical protein
MTDWLLVVQGGQYLVLHFLSLGDNFHAPLFVFERERERERTFFFLFILLVVTQMVIICISAFCSGGNRSGMLMLTIPLIRSDPHSDKGNTCRLAIQGLQFNVKRNKAQACKEKTYTTLQENITYATVGETTTTNTVTILFLFLFLSCWVCHVNGARVHGCHVNGARVHGREISLQARPLAQPTRSTQHV